MNDGTEGKVFLGLVMFGFFLWMLAKLTTRVFVEIGHLFEAIGGAAMGFFGMAWVLTQLAGILGLGVLLIYSAYKYILLVKHGTEIITNVDRRCAELTSCVSSQQEELEARVHANVASLRQELAEALAEPEVGPEPVAEAPVDSATDEVAEAATETAQEQQPENESATTPRVSNPY